MIYGFDPPSVVYTGPVDDENAHDFFKQSPGAFFCHPNGRVLRTRPLVVKQLLWHIYIYTYIFYLIKL